MILLCCSSLALMGLISVAGRYSTISQEETEVVMGNTEKQGGGRARGRWEVVRKGIGGRREKPKKGKQTGREGKVIIQINPWLVQINWCFQLEQQNSNWIYTCLIKNLTFASVNMWWSLMHKGSDVQSQQRLPGSQHVPHLKCLVCHFHGSIGETNAAGRLPLSTYCMFMFKCWTPVAL